MPDTDGDSGIMGFIHELHGFTRIVRGGGLASSGYKKVWQVWADVFDGICGCGDKGFVMQTDRYEQQKDKEML